MSVGTSSFVPKDLTLLQSENVRITHLTLITANTEYSHSLQDGLKQLRIKCKSFANLQYAFVAGESATKYWTIPVGCTDNITDLKFISMMLYVQSNKNSVIVEIMELY